MMRLIVRRDAARVALIGLAVLVHVSQASAATLPPGFEERTLASGLTAPTAVAWAPDGTMFVAEKAGRVRAVSPDGVTQATSLIDISNHVNSWSDRGLIGIGVDAQFSSNRYLYLAYTYESSPGNVAGPKSARLTRVALNADGTLRDPGSPETVVLGTASAGSCPPPTNTLDCIPSDSDSHSIGSVHPAPDGTLWVSTGDAAGYGGVDTLAFRTFDEHSLAGKILHVDRNGRGLSGHPFCPSDTNLDHVCTKLYAKGFRQPFRFTLRSGGNPVVGDVGWLTREELDSVAPGKNYGWPCYEGTVRTAGYSSDSRCKAEYAKEKTAARSVPPIYDYEHVQGQSAVVAGPVYAGTQYPSAYRGMLLFGDYAQGWIKRVALGPGDRPAGTPQVFIRDWYGVALEIGPGGDLAYISFGDGSPGTGSVARVAYSPDDATPVARASASPTWGGVPLRVQFSGNGSSDADGDSLSYSWDFGDGDHSSTPKPVHTYGARGDYVARLTVGDGRGRSDTAHVRISAGNSPPTVRIASPTDGALYRDGGRVSLQGSATDPDDGPLPDSALAWYVLLRHVEHTHPLLAVTGGSHVFDTLRDHDADSFYEITLVATDSRGLASSRTVKVRPKTAWVTLASSPAGAPVSFGGISAKAPFEHLGAVGYHTSVSAAERFKVGGREYEFSRWSDGGAILHAIEIPDAPLKLVAIYRDITPPAPVTPAPDEPSSGDESGPLIEFSQPAGGIIRVLRGTARDRSGVRRVWVALRRKGSLVSRSGVRVCRWWSRSRRRLVMRRCPRAVWLRARLRRVGKRKVMWRVKLGRALPPGRFHAYFRAVDTHGNVGRGLVAGAKRHPEAPQR